MEILIALVVAVAVGRLVYRVGMRGTVTGVDGERLPAPRRAIDRRALWRKQ